MRRRICAKSCPRGPESRRASIAGQVMIGRTDAARRAVSSTVSPINAGVNGGSVGSSFTDGNGITYSPL
jgi:hypothetical protein